MIGLVISGLRMFEKKVVLKKLKAIKRLNREVNTLIRDVMELLDEEEIIKTETKITNF